MKLSSSLLLSLLFCVIASAQNTNNKEIDSLLVLVNSKKQDTSRVNLYATISSKYTRVDIEKATEYNNKALKLSKQLNYVKGLGYYQLNRTKIVLATGKFSEAYFFANKAAIILKRTDDNKRYFEALYFKAYATANQDKFKESELIIKQALTEAKSIKNVELHGFYYLLGAMDSRKNDFQAALQNYQKALFYFRKYNVIRGTISCLYEISSMYIKTNQVADALKYAEKGLKLVHQNKMSDEIFYTLLLVKQGEIFNKMNKYSDALPVLKKALTINEKRGHIGAVTNNLYHLAETYYGLRDFEKTISTCNSRLKWNDNTSSIDFNYMLGKSYYALKQYNNALSYQTKALNQINTKDFYGNNGVSKAEIYNSASKTEFALGNFKQAYLYHTMFASLDKQFLMDEKEKNINRLQTEFDVNEKDIAYKNLTILQQKKEIEIQKEKNNLRVILTILLLIVVFFAFLLWMFRKNKMKNKLLTEQNLIIENKNKELETFQCELKKSLKEKEILLKEIHHRVKNNLQLVMSLLNIQARQSDYSDINDFLEKGQSRISSMALIHQNLYQTENLSKVDFQEYLEYLVDNINLTIGDKQEYINFTINAKNIYFDVEASVPLGLIINELVTNALKHAFPKNVQGKIGIEISQEKEGVFELIVSDNGVGIFNAPKSKKSLGLELVNLLVAQLKGTIIQVAEVGTSYKINFQIMTD